MAARRAEHLLAAGDIDSSLRAWCRAFVHGLAQDGPTALAEVERMVNATTAAGFGHRGRTLGWALEAHVLGMRGEPHRAQELLANARVWATQDGDDDLVALTLYFGAIQPIEADTDRRDLERALDLASASPLVDVISVRLSLASAIGRSGDHTGAIGALEELLPQAAAAGRRAPVLRELAYWLLETGRIDEADAHAKQALALANEVGGSMRAGLYQIAALVAELRGAWDRAERDTRRVLEIRDAMEIASPIGCLNLAELVAGRGADVEASQWLERAGPLQPREQPVGWLVELANHCTRGEWDQAGTVLEHFEARGDRNLATRRTGAWALARASEGGPIALHERLRRLCQKT
jgi:tetratricopeptide (TPR) repeat protein